MSNYIFKAKDKKTGKIVEVLAIDDYFGKHTYGYKTSERVYDEFDFDAAFEKVEHKECTCGYEEGHGLTCPLYTKPKNPEEKT